MQKYKYKILAGIIVGCLCLAIGYGINIRNRSEEVARIPQLKEGTDVYALENEIFDILGPENVAVFTDRSSGSGILWQYDGTKLIVVTAGHLMTDFETGELELWSGEKVTFSAENVSTSSEMDVAVINVVSEESQVTIGAAPYLAEKSPEIGDTMWLLDSVYGAASGISTGQVSAVEIYLEDYGTEMLLLSGTGKTGMSGCPVYNAEGRLAAMMSGMSEDGTILAAVPIGKIMKFLETLGE